MPNKKPFKVIISDVNSRKGFDAVSIMKRLYEVPTILCAERNIKFQLPIIYRQRVSLLRSHSYNVFEKDFSKLLEENSSSRLVYLPVSEKPTRHLLTFLENHKTPEHLNYLLPSKQAFEMTSHKGLFQGHCEEYGFSVPKSFTKSEVLDSKFSFQPLIAKPFSGEGSVGIKHIDRAEQLSTLDSINPNNYLIQEKIQAGQKVAGAFFLCKNGEVLNQYTHQRLRTFPENGGVTVYSRSGNNQEILAIGSELLHSLEWTGLAMIEFMQDKGTNEWKIIELNPRLWGSVMLSAFNGSRMLEDYVRYSLEAPKISKQSHSFAGNKYIRWWFPFELLSFFKGKLTFKQLIKLDLKKTCYINFTYASVYSSLTYLLYFTFNVKSLKRFLKKIS